MAKLKKMLGDLNSPQCAALSRKMESMEQEKLAKWAVAYAKERYLPITLSHYTGTETYLDEAISACELYFDRRMPLAKAKPYLTWARQQAAMLEQPDRLAAANAVVSACFAILTVDSALGAFFYGAAAVAYSEVGLEESDETYNAIAEREFEAALRALEALETAE
ncbi:MAG: hypothetical protein IJC43_04530 [Clostridia bacterium]|nr:hypothetical protein [Clostridia bacterium]